MMPEVFHPAAGGVAVLNYRLQAPIPPPMASRRDAGPVLFDDPKIRSWKEDGTR